MLVMWPDGAVLRVDAFFCGELIIVVGPMLRLLLLFDFSFQALEDRVLA